VSKNADGHLELVSDIFSGHLLEPAVSQAGGLHVTWICNCKESGKSAALSVADLLPAGELFGGKFFLNPNSIRLQLPFSGFCGHGADGGKWRGGF